MMSAWLAIAATGTAFDDYIGTISPNYTWYDLNYTVNPPLIRATAHIINVTSQQGVTEAQAVGPTGAVPAARRGLPHMWMEFGSCRVS